MPVHETITVEDLRKRFGVKDVLRGSSFSVPAGCLFGFLGPNGAGKTTTMNLLTGILLPDSGRMASRRTDVAGKYSAPCRRIGAARQPRPFLNR